jgi:hypothetical protein
MDNVKLSVTIELQGNTMMSSQVCDENPKENYNYETIQIPVKKYDKKKRKTYFTRAVYNIATRKCISAKQVMHLSEESYEYFISQEVPEWFTQGINQWKKLSNKERLELNLDRLCKGLGGFSYTYVVFND